MRKKIKIQDNQLTFKLSTELKNQLYAFADAQKVSVGDCMRVSVEQFLHGHYERMTEAEFFGTDMEEV